MKNRSRMFSSFLMACANRFLEALLDLGISKAHLRLDEEKFNFSSEPGASSDITTLTILYKQKKEMK
jgi:hypothetical protein